MAGKGAQEVEVLGETRGIIPVIEIDGGIEIEAQGRERGRGITTAEMSDGHPTAMASGTGVGTVTEKTIGIVVTTGMVNVADEVSSDSPNA